MRDQATVPQGEHDLAGPNFFRRAAFDLDDIARPKSRQHAFPVNLSANTQTRSRAGGATQHVGHQS
jgi:hypothetical protein